MIGLRWLRSTLSLVLAGGVVAASSGVAVHDPDCPHHSFIEAGHGGQAAHGPHGTHEGAHPESPPSSLDCECAGFCALVGGTLAVQVEGVSQGLEQTPVLLAPEGTDPDGRPAGLSSVVLPPSTGPPHDA